MKKNKLVLLTLSLLLAGCAGNQAADTQTEQINETTVAVSETSTEAKTEESQSDETEPETTEAEIETTENSTESKAAETTEVQEETVWETTAPASVNAAPSEEEVEAAEQEILENGTLLFEGEENEGYYPDDLSWLANADMSDIVAIQYSCDVADHGGWGVLGLRAGEKQDDISAYADNPEKVRLLTYTVEDLCKKAGTDSSENMNFSIGAWNGGHIHAVYFLSGDTATELTDYMESVDEASAIIHTYTGELSNENAIPEAVSVYDYLCEVWNNGEGCLTGQMESTWMGSADYEMNYIEDVSGKLPAIRGLDFMHNDFEGVVKRAEQWWDKGGIVTICWHTGSDFASGYNECLSSDLNWDDAFTPGTETYSELLADMDRAVPYLQELEDAGVPVLWRPFHELDGGWFWWSKGGSENFVKLWQLMYSRYTDYWGLDNLIWVFGYSHNGVDMEAWYPGDDYVDLIGADSYTAGANKSLYESVCEVAADGMPIVFHECGTIPTEKQMEDAETNWLFFMVWHTDYITSESNNTKESIKEIYNSDYFITLDELPDFK